MDYKNIARLEREKSLGFQNGTSYQKPNESLGARSKLLNKTAHAKKRNFSNEQIKYFCDNIVFNRWSKSEYILKLETYLEELEQKGL